MLRRRSYWVHPDTHDVVKFMPHNPPERGDRVLVDGERHEVVRCPVTWDGRRWTMKRGVKVRPLAPREEQAATREEEAR